MFIWHHSEMALIADLECGSPGARQRLLTAITTAIDSDRDAAADLLDGAARLAATGNQEARELLIEVTLVKRLAERPIRRVLLDPADVDDAVQNTLIAIAEKIERFQSRSRFTTWLHTVARNEALMVLRRKKPAGQLEDELGPSPGFVQRLSSVVVNEHRVQRAIASLPERQRLVVELREMQGIDYEEIARRLDVPIGTVRSRINRARAALAEMLLTGIEPN